jgi:hypothetical protein
MKSNKNRKTRDEFLKEVSDASLTVLTSSSQKAVREGFEKLICNVSTKCLSDVDESWGDGVSYELMRCAVPTKMMQSFKARLHGTAMWEKFAEDCYLRLFYALYKDILPESKPEFDYKHKRKAECGRMDRLKSDLSAAAAAVESRKAADRAAAVKLRKTLSKYA